MKFDLSTIFKKPSAVAVISVIIAVVLWFVVVYSISPDDKMEITEVPVKIELPSASELNVVKGKNATVTVKVEGKRYNIGNLKSDEVALRAVVSDVTRPGTYTLDVEAVQPLDNRYEVTAIYPETIRVTFDRVATKTLTIEQEITGLSVPDENYMLGDISIDPGMVTVQGPEKEIDKIVRAVIKQEFTEPITDTQNLEMPIILLDSYGNEVKTKLSGEGYVTTSTEKTTVNIPVMEIVEMPLTLSFVNVPDDFPRELLHYSISNETITVAATADVLSRYYEIPVGHVDLSNLDLTKNSSVTFDMELPEEMINCNNIESVIVEFNVKDLSSKTVKIRDIKPINVPPNLKVQLKSNLLNVKLVGDEKTIDALLPQGVIAEIDFASQEVAVGQYHMPVRIYMPTDEFVWAIGKYSVVVSVTEK